MSRYYKNNAFSLFSIIVVLVGMVALPALAQEEPAASLEQLFNIETPPAVPAQPAENTIPAASPIATEDTLAQPAAESAKPVPTTDSTLESLLNTLPPLDAAETKPFESGSIPDLALPQSTSPVPSSVAAPAEPPSQLDDDLANLLRESEKAVPLRSDSDKKPTVLTKPIEQQKPQQAVPMAAPAEAPSLPSQRLPSQKMADTPVENNGLQPVFDPEVDVFAPPSETVTLYEEGPRGRGFRIPDAKVTFESERLPPQAFAPMKDALLMRLEFMPFHSILPPYGDRALKPMADLLLQNPNIVVTVQGYADVTEKGTVRSARNIAENRTHTVANYLISNGVQPQQIVREAVGLDLVMGVARDRVDVRYRDLLSAPAER